MSSPWDLYSAHFELSERPFALTPDPDFLFWTKIHKRAFSVLEYGLFTGAPITLITGEVGAGKTTLIQYLLGNAPADLTIGLVSNAGERGQLLRWAMTSLGQTTREGADYVDLFKQFQDFLIDEYSQGRRVVLIFDEAQNLDHAALEELRMYTNINSNKDILVQCVLVGQPELRDILKEPSLEQFCQRIVGNMHLKAMDVETVVSYIEHRMLKAGAAAGIFTAEAAKLIGHASRGIPRIVNQIADLCLVYASSDDMNTVGDETVRNVLRDGVVLSAPLYLE
ncbi:MAG: AAA family ATPase [Litoreibacter sp.]